jgi:hypothetical protein
MVTFGADPDDPKREREYDEGEVRNGWQVRPKKATAGRAAPAEILFYFTTHRNQGMHQRFGEKDRIVISVTARKLLKGGVTVEEMKDAIDRLFESDAGRKSQHPGILFASKDVLRRIVKTEGGQLDRMFEHKDAADIRDILTWLGNNFQRTDDLLLPWPPEDDKSIKNLILLDATPALFSYPEIVATLLAEGGEFEKAIRCLMGVLRYSWGELDTPPQDVEDYLPDLPASVLDRNRVRHPADSWTDALLRAESSIR